MILHVVLYQPKDSATPAELAELVTALQTASREIPSVRQVRVGRALDFGFGYETWPKDQNSGHVAVFEFKDRTGLEHYLRHPLHKALSEMFWKTCDQPTIIDVSAIDAKAEHLAEIFGQIGDK